MFFIRLALAVLAFTAAPTKAESDLLASSNFNPAGSIDGTSTVLLRPTWSPYCLRRVAANRKSYNDTAVDLSLCTGHDDRMLFVVSSANSNDPLSQPSIVIGSKDGADYLCANRTAPDESPTIISARCDRAKVSTDNECEQATPDTVSNISVALWIPRQMTNKTREEHERNLVLQFSLGDTNECLAFEWSSESDRRKGKNRSGVLATAGCEYENTIFEVIVPGKDV